MSVLPWPVADADTQDYWDAIAERRFLIQRCRSCRRYQYYPRSVCTACTSTDLELVASQGRGTIYSYTVSRRAAHPDMAERVPYVVALIDLAEGPRMLANLVGVDPENVTIGADVAVTFLQAAEGILLPAFEIVASQPAQNSNQEETDV
jgi:hypothetical protein